MAPAGDNKNKRKRSEGPQKKKRKRRKATQEDGSQGGTPNAGGKRGSKRRVSLPPDKIRVGFSAWHVPVANGVKLQPRKCRVIGVSQDLNDFLPIKIKYSDNRKRMALAKLGSGWTDPQYLEFEEKYSAFKLEKGLQCWHRPIYRGITLPPQLCVINEIDNDDPIKNIRIIYKDQEASVFGKVITFREGWINDRDLIFFDSDFATYKKQFRVLERHLLMEPTQGGTKRIILRKDNNNRQRSAPVTPSKAPKFAVGDIAYHKAMIGKKETRPLQVEIVERDETGTPRNCKIQYKDKEIEVGNQMHRLIGGWVEHTSLIPPPEPEDVRWSYLERDSKDGKKKRAKYKEVVILAVDSNDGEVLIEFVHDKKAQLEDILGGWVSAINLRGEPTLVMMNPWQQAGGKKGEMPPSVNH